MQHDAAPTFVRIDLERREFVELSTQYLVTLVKNYDLCEVNRHTAEIHLQLHQRDLTGECINPEWRELPRAMKLGHPIAIALYYVDLDLDRAYDILFASYKRGHPTAAYYLAERFPCKVNPVEMHTFAAERECIESMFELYCYYEFRDPALSCKWLEKSAARGHVRSCNEAFVSFAASTFDGLRSAKTVESLAKWY